MTRFLPFLDLHRYRKQDLSHDLVAAIAVTLLCIPQGVAYAMIAGLPPAMGLYAGAIPAIIASLFRSSRHLITGPTNAVSLLVATTMVAGVSGSPMTIAVTLALMVGSLQIGAGLLRLGAVVDFISGAVVLGFITGAALLIGLGQLPNLTGTPSAHGALFEQLGGWMGDLAQASPIALGLGLGTAIVIEGLRRWNHRMPAALIGLAGATALSIALGLDHQGVRVISSLVPIRAALPPLTLPDLSLMRALLPHAVAITVLSMVESTSMARAIAHRTGQRIDISAEFTGEGLGNIAGAFFGAYPATGSLSRSALNEREGARSRMAGVFSGVMVLVVPLLLAPVLDQIPIAALAGMLIAVALRLVDLPHIRRVMRSHNGDRGAFLATLLATFVLSLEHAVYLGVGISLINVLRRARLLATRDLVIDNSGRLREVSTRSRQLGPEGFHQRGVRYCRSVHILNIQGSLFFGAASQLQAAIDDVLRNEATRVVILRLKRVRNLDLTTVDVLTATARNMRAEGRHLLLLGMSQSTAAYFERMGLAEVVGQDNLFPTRDEHWFAALEDALRRAISLSQAHQDCPYRSWLASRPET